MSRLLTKRYRKHAETGRNSCAEFKLGTTRQANFSVVHARIQRTLICAFQRFTFFSALTLKYKLPPDEQPTPACLCYINKHDEIILSLFPMHFFFFFQEQTVISVISASDWRSSGLRARGLEQKESSSTFPRRILEQRVARSEENWTDAELSCRPVHHVRARHDGRSKYIAQQQRASEKIAPATCDLPR